MDRSLLSGAFALGLFLGVLVLLEVGRRYGKRRLAREAEGARAGLGVVDGAVFSLLGLLLAFSFSGAATRFEGRRSLILAEANAVGTAWLRLSLLPPESQLRLQELFRQYLDKRLSAYQSMDDLQEAAQRLEAAVAIQGEIWAEFLRAAQTDQGQRALVPLVVALNAMFDMATTRTVAAQEHPPMIIFVMIAVLSLVSALLAGYGMAGSKERSWLHVLGFSLVLSLTAYVILDLEYPRLGIIRIDAADQILRDVRKSMK
jgi:hypothetical protein